MRRVKRVARTSPDLVAEQIERLRALFPDTFSEGRVDWDRLRTTLGEIVDERPERYSFTWAGKRDAIRALQIPSRATLIPCPEESVSWDNTQHVFIEGENLEVLKLLYKAYFGRVKMIYIDPPYNTGNDFVYPDNYADPLDTYLRMTGQRDSEGNLLTSNPQTSGRYHSAWLSMMYPRLFVARQLLRDDGVIFVSIDDNEVHNLRMLMNEVFGEENFVASIIWRKKVVRGRGAEHVLPQTEYVLVYARSLSFLPPFSEPLTSDMLAEYDLVDEVGRYKLIPLAKSGTAHSPRPNLVYPIEAPDGSLVQCPTHQWRWSRETLKERWNEIEFRKNRAGQWVVFTKQYLIVDGERREKTPESYYDRFTTTDGTEEAKALFGSSVMEFPKPSSMLADFVTWIGHPGSRDVVVDFFAGSCPTAQAVIGLNREDGGNRRFVVVQLPEPLDSLKKLDDGTVLYTIADIGKERIRRVIKRMQEEDAGKLDLPTRENPEDLGFRVFKLAESGFRQWSPPNTDDAETIATQLGMFHDPLLAGWTPERVIAEVALKEVGYGLDYAVQKHELKGNTIWQVTDPGKGQTFRLCLDETISAKTVRALSLRKDDVFICRDKALDDSLAANLALQCDLRVL